MRILLITPLFQPEPNHLKGLDFAVALENAGHSIEVLTLFPNYPSGKIYDGYRLGAWMIERIQGVRVVRVASYLSHDSSSLRRAISYLSFALSASLLGPLLLTKPDVIHVYQGPSTIAIPAIVFNVLGRIPWVLDVQDLWPESVTSAGMVKSKFIIKVLSWWSHVTYNLSTSITVLSDGCGREIAGRGACSSKVHVVHNWSNEAGLNTKPLDKAAMSEHRLSGKFNITFAGTLGKAQGLDTIIEAASLVSLDSNRIQFVFIGDGVERSHLMHMTAQLGLTNVIFVNRQAPEVINSFLKASDVLLLHLKDDALGHLAIPQKTQAYLAVGKPILLCGGGDVANIVTEASAGVVCRPEDAKSIADGARRLASMEPSALERMGSNGRRFYIDKLAFSKGFPRMESILVEAAKGT